MVDKMALFVGFSGGKTRFEYGFLLDVYYGFPLLHLT